MALIYDQLESNAGPVQLQTQQKSYFTSGSSYRGESKFWTHWKQYNAFCDLSVRKKDWHSHARGAQAT